MTSAQSNLIDHESIWAFVVRLKRWSKVLTVTITMISTSQLIGKSFVIFEIEFLTLLSWPWLIFFSLWWDDSYEFNTQEILLTKGAIDMPIQCHTSFSLVSKVITKWIWFYSKLKWKIIFFGSLNLQKEKTQIHLSSKE